MDTSSGSTRKSAMHEPSEDQEEHESKRLRLVCDIGPIGRYSGLRGFMTPRFMLSDADWPQRSWPSVRGWMDVAQSTPPLIVAPLLLATASLQVGENVAHD